MDRKFIDEIDGQATFFKLYLQYSLSKEGRKLLDNIATKTSVYIFSGIIRNFFLGESSYRDLDIVVDNLDDIKEIIQHLESEVSVKNNSFGGLKLTIEGLNIDIWSIRNTWGIKKDGLKLTPESLLKTAFFNFSAIVFDYNNARFYYDEAFPDFLSTRMMNVVYESNPNIPLCIINTYYYRIKYGFGISLHLCIWIFVNYLGLSMRHQNREKILENVQKKHFGSMIVDFTELKDFVLNCGLHYRVGSPISPAFYG